MNQDVVEALQDVRKLLDEVTDIDVLPAPYRNRSPDRCGVTNDSDRDDVFQSPYATHR